MSAPLPEGGLNLLLATLMRRRNLALILGLSALAAALAFALSFVFDPRYAATAVVVQADSRGGASGLARIASSFGGLAGIEELVSPGRVDQAATRELLESRAILRALIERHDLLPVLFAERWDARSNTWISGSPENPPSLGDAIELLDRDVRRIVVVRETGAIKVTMRWTDPDAAAAWANSLIALVNEQATGAIDEPPAGFQKPQGAVDQVFLQLEQAGEIRAVLGVGQIGVAPDRARRGARRIEEDRVTGMPRPAASSSSGQLKNGPLF